MTSITTENGLPADRTTLAIGLALLGVTCISFADIATKWISSDISLWQLLTMRSIVGLVLILPILLMSRRLSSLRIKNHRTLAIRTAIMCTTYLLFFTSLGQLPLAIVAGAFFTGPMFMVLLSVLMLKEPVGIWRILSVLSGFTGTLLILRPDSADFSPIMLMPVASGFFYALAQVYTRKYCKQENPMAISYWLTFTFMLMGLSGMLGVYLLADGSVHTLPQSPRTHHCAYTDPDYRGYWCQQPGHALFTGGGLSKCPGQPDRITGILVPANGRNWWHDLAG